MKSLTIAKVSQVRGGHIDLHGLEKVLGVPDGGQVLLVGTSSKFIRVIPVSSSAVIMLRVAFYLSDFAVSARQVLKVLKGMGVSMIHSTGFCPVSDSKTFIAFTSLTTSKFPRLFGRFLGDILANARKSNAVFLPILWKCVIMKLSISLRSVDATILLTVSTSDP